EPAHAAEPSHAKPSHGAPEEPPARPAPARSGLTSRQRDRLASLKRLCDSGTLTPAECAGKRAAILQEP
ncbi:MAG TPA: hypothetical protein VHB21_01945, partial [Minicystis sp.]|nr:hypothetical protein [Minicystis sp.]